MLFRSYKSKSDEEKRQFNDQTLNEFIAKINQESKDAGEPLKLPTVDEYYARKQAVSKWIDTVARNYMEKDLGSITTKEGKDVSSDIVIKLLAEGYSPLTDKEIADMVKSNVNQRDVRAMRKELGFESSGYFAKDLSALAKSLKKEEASLTSLLDDFNARYERAMQTNHEREARGQETLDPGVIDPSLRDLKKQEKAMRASISEIQHKIAEHKNAQKMEFAIDSAMSEGTLLPHWKSYKLDNDTDRAAYPKIMNVPEEFAGQTKVYTPNSWRLKEAGLARILGDYVKDVMAGKITIKNGVPTKPLDGFIREKYAPHRKEMREERFAKDNFIPLLNQNLKVTLMDSPNVDRFGKNNLFGNYKLVNTDYTNPPEDIRIKLSQSTEVLDHCIGRGGSGEGNHWRYDSSRNYTPLYNTALNKRNPNVSSSDTSFMTNAIMGRQEFPELRDAVTGMPEVTFEFSRANWDDSHIRSVIRDSVEDLPDTPAQVMEIIARYEPQEAIIKLQRDYPKFGLIASKAYWDEINSMPRKFNIGYASGFQNNSTNFTNELQQSMVDFLNSRSDEIENSGGGLNKWKIYDTKDKSPEDVASSSYMSLTEEEREKLPLITLPRFVSNVSLKEALANAPDLTPANMTKPIDVTQKLNKIVNESYNSYGEKAYDIARRIANPDLHPQEFIEAMEAQIAHVPDYYNNPSHVTEGIESLQNLIDTAKKYSGLNLEYYRLHNIENPNQIDDKAMSHLIRTSPYKFIRRLEDAKSGSFIGEAIRSSLDDLDIYSSAKEIADKVREKLYSNFDNIERDRPDIVNELNMYMDALEKYNAPVKERPTVAIPEDVSYKIAEAIKRASDESVHSSFENKIDEILAEGAHFKYDPKGFVERLREVAAFESNSGSTARAERFRKLANTVNRIYTGIEDSAGITMPLSEQVHNLMHDEVMGPVSRNWIRSIMDNFANNPRDLDRFINHVDYVISDKLLQSSNRDAVASLEYLKNNALRGQSKMTLPPSDIVSAYNKILPQSLSEMINKIGRAHV